MPIITLTSDLGIRDSYVASIKGFLLGKVPTANIVDVSHQVRPFHIAEASFILRNCYADFPEGAIHVVSVNAYSTESPRFILMQAGGYYFIANDNGLLSLVLQKDVAVQIHELPYEKADLVFPFRNIMAPIAAKLANGAKPEVLGTPTTAWIQLAHQEPITTANMLRGAVQYIDTMGNVVTNIAKSQIQDRNCRIFISQREYFDEISGCYNEVEEGEKVCFFNSSGYLEIAINQGNAEGLLGLRLGSNIMVELL